MFCIKLKKRKKSSEIIALNLKYQHFKQKNSLTIFLISTLSYPMSITNSNN